MAASRAILREGELGLQKKKGVESRFFVLYEDRLAYFKAAAAFHAGEEARGELPVSEIHELEVSDNSFRLDLGDQSLTLVALQGEDLSPWITTFQQLLAKRTEASAPSPGDVAKDFGEVFHSGVLQVPRKGSLQQRYFVLTRERFFYYDTQADWLARKEPKGGADLTDVTEVEYREDGFTVHLRIDSRPLEFHWDKTEDIQAWTEGWRQAIAGRSATIVTHHNVPPLAGISEQTTVLEGLVNISKKGRVEQRYCALFSDRFEYHRSQGDYSAGREQPRCLIPVDEIQRIQVTSGGSLRICLEGQQLELLPSSEDLRKWRSAWEEVVPGAVHELVEDSEEGPVGTAAPEDPDTLCSGTFRLERTGAACRVNCILRRDKLRYAQSEPSGNPADFNGFVLTSEIDDLEVENDGFTIHIRGNKPLVLRDSGGTSLEDWVQAFGRVFDEEPSPPEPAATRHQAPRSSSSTARPARSLHEGVLELGWGARREPRFVILHADRVELFASDSEALMGRAPLKSIWLSDVLDFKALDAGFEVKANAGVFSFRAPAHSDYCTWLKAWGQALRRSLETLHHDSGGDAEWSAHGHAHDHHSAPAPPLRPPPKEARVLHRGFLRLGRRGHVEVRYFIVFQDRLEHYVDERSAMEGSGFCGRVWASDVREVRVLDHGFVLGLDAERLDLRLLPGEDPDLWVRALREALVPGSPQSASDELDEATVARTGFLSPHLGPLGAVEKGSALSPRQPLSQLLMEAAAPAFQDWLASLREQPCHHGPLGFQQEGRLVMKYCLLQKDCLEAFNRPSDPSLGRPPALKLMLSEVRGLETIGSGFILNMGGRKVGVHVGSNDDLHAWSAALLAVLAPNSSASASPATTPRSAKKKSTGSMLGASVSSTRSAPRQTRPSDWIPKAATTSTVASSSPQSVRGPSWFSQRAIGKRLQINTHKAGLQAAGLIHGPATLTLVHSQQASGREYLRQEVARKINERAVSAGELRRTSPTFADKVTGAVRSLTPRSRPDAFVKITEAQATPRDMSNRHREVTGKVNEVGKVALLCTSRHMAAKVTEADRQPLKQPDRCGSQPILGKVTDAGRASSGWALTSRPASTDKLRSIADTGKRHRRRNSEPT